MAAPKHKPQTYQDPNNEIEVEYQSYNSHNGENRVRNKSNLVALLDLLPRLHIFVNKS